MANKKNLTTEERWWAAWVIKNLAKSGVMFVDARRDQRIAKGRCLLVIDPRDLQTIPHESKGLIARVNPHFKNRGRDRKKT